MPLPWEEYVRRVQAFEGNPRDPGFYRPKWDVRQWTSGYGTRARGPGETIDLPEAERRFGEEFGGARDRVRSRFPDLSPGREAALASLTMNAGEKWMGSGLGRAVGRGDWQDAMQRLLQYTSPDPRYRAGLFKRRQQEAGWMGDQGPSAPLGGATKPPLPGAPMMGLGVRPALGHFNFFQQQPGNFPTDPLPDMPAVNPLMLPPPPDQGQPPQIGAAQPMAPEPEGPQVPMSPLDMPPPGGKPGINVPPTDADELAMQPPPPPDQFAGIGGMPVPPISGVTVSTPPATDSAAPPGPAFGPPIPREIMERRGPAPGMSPDEGGGFYRYFTKNDKPQGARGFFSTAYNAFANPITGAGLSLLFPQAKAGEILAGAAGKRGAERRAEEHLQLQKEEGQRAKLTWQEKMEEIDRAKRAYGQMFPGEGQTNLDHPALKGLPPELVEAIRGLPPADAVKATSELRFKTQAQREALAQEMERMRLIQQMEEGGAAPATAAPGLAPPSMAPAVPQSAGLPPIGMGGPAGLTPPAEPRPSLPAPTFGGAAIAGGMPGGQSAVPPALAPAPPSPGAPVTPVTSAPPIQRPPAAEEMVEIGNRRFTIPEARRRLEIQKRFKQETGLQDAINAAEKRQEAALKEAQPTDATKTKVSTIDRSFHILDRELDKYKTLVRKTGMVYANDAEKDAVVNSRKEIQLQLKNLYELGALQKPDLPFIDLLPDPEFALGIGTAEGWGPNWAPLTGKFVPWSDTIETRTDAAVDRLKESIREQRNEAAKQVGLPPIPAPEKKKEEKELTPKQKMKRGKWKVEEVEE